METGLDSFGGFGYIVEMSHNDLESAGIVASVRHRTISQHFRRAKANRIKDYENIREGVRPYRRPKFWSAALAARLRKTWKFL